ncbi:hypothetical protein INT47_012404, partial [Mucor saturninus]
LPPRSRNFARHIQGPPLLFNLAFEPLLRSILGCSGLSGVSLGGGAASSAVCPLVLSVWIDTPNFSDRDFISQSVVIPPSPVKLLSSAEDLEVFLTGPGEWPVSKSLLDCYGLASNAKVNLSKTVLVSLSGVGHTEWVDIAQSEGLEWHDSGSRNLSLRGSGLVANSLILSRLWHILRVVSVPAKWLDSVQALVRGYLLPFWPRPSMSTMYVPRKFGGVSLVDNQTTDNLRNTGVVNASKVKEVRRALYPSDGWFAATGFLPTALLNQTNSDVLLPTWLPALYHWTIPQGCGYMVIVSGICPGDLRWYWHPDPAKLEIRAVIPQVVSTRFLLRPSLWQLFWSLDMTSEAFTPWWRLIQDCIGYRAKLHRRSPTKYPCASCPICLVSSSKDLFHFVAGCFDKWPYLVYVISLLGIGNIFETEFDVWSGLVSLCDRKQKPLSADMLTIIGSGFATLWKYHWRCVIKGDLWSSQAALTMFQQDHLSLIADNLSSQSPLLVNYSLVMPSG